jgi:methyl coenzyme M reductase subunit C-like uncharacterized protein (methanogenesis marker protein 7)
LPVRRKGKKRANLHRAARISAGSTKTVRNHHRRVESDPPVAAGTIVGDDVVRKLMIVKEIVAPQAGLEPATLRLTALAASVVAVAGYRNLVMPRESCDRGDGPRCGKLRPMFNTGAFLPV